jgi:hypothetical protein
MKGRSLKSVNNEIFDLLYEYFVYFLGSQSDLKTRHSRPLFLNFCHSFDNQMFHMPWVVAWSFDQLLDSAYVCLMNNMSVVHGTAALWAVASAEPLLESVENSLLPFIYVWYSLYILVVVAFLLFIIIVNPCLFSARAKLYVREIQDSVVASNFCRSNFTFWYVDIESGGPHTLWAQHSSRKFSQL